MTYRARRPDEPLRRVPEPPRAWKPAGPSDEIVRRLAKALGVEPEHFREYRLRLITKGSSRCPS